MEDVAHDLTQDRQSFLAIWTAFQGSVLRQDLDAIAERAGGESGDRISIIVDDLDLLADDALVARLHRLSQRPGVRIVSTTIHPIEGTAYADDVHQIPGSTLYLSRDETRLICEEASRLSGVELSAEDAARIHELGRGIPLPVSIALDRTLSGDRSLTDPLPTIFGALSAHMFRSYQPFAFRPNTVSGLFATLSLLPRFTEAQLSRLFPDASRMTVAEVLNTPIYDTSRRVLPGEHVWIADYWRAASRWATNRRDVGMRLIDMLLEIDDAAAAFGQMILLGDLERAERTLRRRFLTVYENLAPEIAEIVAHTAATAPHPHPHPHPHPMLALLRTLLAPGQDHEDMRRLATVIEHAAEKETAESRILMTAVLSAVDARTDSRADAVDRARCAIVDAVHELSTGEASDRATRLVLVESALIGTLALLECETFPEVKVLPLVSESTFLTARFGCAWSVVHRLQHGAVDASREPTPASDGTGYRSLLYSAASCHREAMTIDEYDRRFAQALTADDLPLSSHDLPRSIATLSECLSRLAVGDVPGAIAGYEKTRLSAPYGAILGGALMLMSGREVEALELLDGLDDSWGPRTAAYTTPLKAFALLHSGDVDAARSLLEDAERLPHVALVQAVTLLPADRAEDLCALTPFFRSVWDAARRVGVLGSNTLVDTSSAFPRLTRRERAVLDALRRGLTRKEIAAESFLSIHTVKGHIRSIGIKLGIRGQDAIVRRATELGI